MLLSAAIITKNGDIFCSNQLPYELKVDIAKHANNFLYALSIQDSDIELPYIESTTRRYIYKQTDDLYWLMVTKPDSEMFTDIHSLGKFVCTIMEYGSIETNSKTLTDEQRELFYRHIWRPWDDGSPCPACSRHGVTPDIWEREFESRLQFLVRIKDGHVDEEDVQYFNGLMTEAWSISASLNPRWSTATHDDSFSDSDSFCSNDPKHHSINEDTLIDGCRLKCRLEDIRIEITRIQDPYLRLFARRDLLINVPLNESQQVSAPTMKELELISGQQSGSEFL